MRKLSALILAVALVVGMASMADAQQTYTWTTIRGAGVYLHWPNEANARNIFETENGLLGRITADLNPNVAQACQLAPSYDCTSITPPAFLMAAGQAEGPPNGGGADECNRVVTSCGAPTPHFAPVAGGGHLNDTEGTYSYLSLHTDPALTAGGKLIGFFSGSFTQTAQPFKCNDCPAGGIGKDVNDQFALDNTAAGSIVTSTNVDLWTTQTSAFLGHSQITLWQAFAGKASICGNSIAFQTLRTDLCTDGLGTTASQNFLIPEQKVVTRVFSTTLANHATKAVPGLCNPPDCYIQNVIIPAAIAQNANAKNVAVQTATSILPPDAPPPLGNATVDSLLYYYTTQLIDMDGDGNEDRTDPCPNDPGDACLTNPFTGPCPNPGEVFCTDRAGAVGCIQAYLCDTRRDVNQDCQADSADVADVTFTLFFNSGLPIGPFDP